MWDQFPKTFLEKTNVFSKIARVFTRDHGNNTLIWHNFEMFHILGGIFFCSVLFGMEFIAKYTTFGRLALEKTLRWMNQRTLTDAKDPNSSPLRDPSVHTLHKI